MDTPIHLLPTALAVIGVVTLFLTRGSARTTTIGRLARSSDLLWCGGALIAKVEILYSDLAVRITPNAHPFDLGLVALLLAILMWLPSRLRAATTFLITAATSIWIWGDLVHYRFFEDVASGAALLAAGNGTVLWESIEALSRAADAWLLLDLLPAFILTVVLVRAPSRKLLLDAHTRTALALLLVLMIPGLARHRQISLAPQKVRETHRFLNVNLVREYGLYGFHLFDTRQSLIRALRPLVLTDSDRDFVREWFLERAPERAARPPWDGFASGRNLIIVQVESLQAFALGTFEGQEITPNINRLSETALVFHSTYDQVSLGRTSDAELMAMASLLPNASSAAAFTYQSNTLTALPKLLRESGYTTLSAVAFRPSFWNRHVMHPSYGFSTTLFRNDFEAGEKIGWGLNDRDFLRQSITRLEELEPPFFAYLITLSMHTPYKHFPDHLRRLDPALSDGSSVGNYLEGMHFFDAAFGEFWQALELRGLLENSVVVLFGDHDAGLRGDRRISRNFGFRPRPLLWNLYDQIPLMMWIPGDGAPRGEIEGPSGLSDLPVTLLALFGIDPAGYAMVGRNLLTERTSTFIARNRLHFVDDTHYFVARRGLFEAGDCYLRSTRREVERDLCRPTFDLVQRQRRASSLVLEYDLQPELSEYLKAELEE